MDNCVTDAKISFNAWREAIYDINVCSLVIEQHFQPKAQVSSYSFTLFTTTYAHIRFVTMR